MKRIAVAIALLAAVTLSARAEQFPSYVTTPTGIATFDVTKYGAAGNGVTDDRTAITNAMTAACAASQPAVLFFPAGSYPMSRNGTHPYSLNIACSNLTFQGVPGRSTIMQPTGMPDAAVTIISMSSGVSHVAFRDLIVDGNWQNAVGTVAPASDGVAMTGTFTVNLDDASEFPTAGGAFTVMSRGGAVIIHCTGATSTALTGCTTSGSGTLYARMVVGYCDVWAGINQTTQSTADTTIASASNGLSLPQSTINVAATTGFTTNPGNVRVFTTDGWVPVACTGLGTGTLTGCTGGTGTMSTGGEVFQQGLTQGRNPGIAIAGSQYVTLDHVQIRRIYGDCIDVLEDGITRAWAQHIKILNSECSIASRDGIALIGGVDDLLVDGFRAFYVIAQAVDAEPVGYPLRNIEVRNSYLDGWWDKEYWGSAPVTIGGGGTSTQVVSTDGRHWRFHDNEILGAVFFGNSSDVVFDHNRVVLNFTGAQPNSAISVGGWNSDLVISRNYVYARAQYGGVEGEAGAIQLTESSAIVSPSTVIVRDNDVHVRNGREGIVVNGVGGASTSGGYLTTTGTATTITTTTLIDTSATWTANKWLGARVLVGNAIATIASNTACPGTCTLTLNNTTYPTTTAWFQTLGDPTQTPAVGAYSIYWPTGFTDVSRNFIEASNDDGQGSGGACIAVTSDNDDSPFQRVWVHDNVLRDCGGGYGLYNRFYFATTTELVAETNNFAFDDQNTASMTTMLGLFSTANVTKYLFAQNVDGQQVTHPEAGLSSGTWLVRDGAVQRWAGYGAPAIAAPVGSLYTRVDGGASTTLYVKEATGTTWVAK